MSGPSSREFRVKGEAGGEYEGSAEYDCERV
jgi:hypothetical protein